MIKRAVAASVVLGLLGCDKKETEATTVQVSPSGVTVQANGGTTVVSAAGAAVNARGPSGAVVAAQGDGGSFVRAGNTTVKTGEDGNTTVNTGGVKVETKDGKTKVVVPGMGTITE